MRRCELSLVGWRKQGALPAARRLAEQRDRYLRVDAGQRSRAKALPDRGSALGLRPSRRSAHLPARRRAAAPPARATRSGDRPASACCSIPTPEFASLTLGRVERLRSRNSFGHRILRRSRAACRVPAGKTLPACRGAICLARLPARRHGRRLSDPGVRQSRLRGPEHRQAAIAVGVKATTDYVEGTGSTSRTSPIATACSRRSRIRCALAVERGIADPKRASGSPG
jgi:hypothetical protein